MRNLKVVVLVFGIVGLISMFLPLGDGMPSMFKLFMEFDKVQLLLMLAAFGIPTAVGAIGLAKPPFKQVHAGLAVAGFGLASFKMEIWKAISHIGAAPLSAKLMLIAAAGGLIVSILALVKPEPQA
ncbi:MAG: hypothetical protein ACTHU0_02430 [Kofleriaceae bacterium]